MQALSALIRAMTGQHLDFDRVHRGALTTIRAAVSIELIQTSSLSGEGGAPIKATKTDVSEVKVLIERKLNWVLYVMIGILVTAVGSLITALIKIWQ